MAINVDPVLVALCRRDEWMALRDRARRAAAQGDAQAGFVAAWMEQMLAKHPAPSPAPSTPPPHDAAAHTAASARD